MYENRDSFIDILKGVAVILVVIGHVIQIVYSPQNFDNNILFKLIYSFHMPLFMIISGYCEGISKRKKDMFFLVRRIKNLLIPFFVWTIILSMYNHIIFRIDILSYLINVFKRPDNSFWFIWVLFLLDLFLCLYSILYDTVFSLVKCLSNSKLLMLSTACINFGIILVILFFLSKFNFLGFGLAVHHSIYFFSGYFISNYNLNKIKIPKYFIIFLIFTFIYLINFWNRIPNYSMLSSNIFLSQKAIYTTFKIFMAYLGIIISVESVKIICKHNSNAILFAKLGNYSKQIYLMQNFFIKNYLGNIAIDTFVSIILGVFIPYLIAKTMDKYSKLNSLLFGTSTNANN